MLVNPERLARRGFSHFARERCGAALIEFSLIAFLLLFVIFSTIEIGLVYWATEQIENGSNSAARLVRTGQVQTQSLNQAQLKTEICARAHILPNCLANLRLDVRSAASYAAIVPPDALDSDGELKEDNEFSFSPGAPQDVALVTTFYSWPVSFFGGPYILRASVPLRNEPF
ncbi:MAG: TadE/TadG family type IV pilus assembly protein [Pseudomonadota bacterium]